MKKYLITIIQLLLIHAATAKEQVKCPIFVDDEIDAEEVVEYKGKKVFMCCGTCVKEWNKNPDYYAKVAQVMKSAPQIDGIDLSKVKLLAQRFCPIRNDRVVHPESPSVEYKGKKIYFFKSSDMKRRWNSDPDGVFAKARAAGLLPQYDKK